ncbi:MAG: hypothetical protein IKZ95_06115 [Lachnospiraceae bacterium]|nr:hypothetical protein [Lachnospiraceae bacterium]
MDKQGLIIGIDYTKEYCQASYYSTRHNCPESIASGTEVMRYLIPTAICYDSETEEWLIGQAAVDHARESGARLFDDLLQNIFQNETCYVNDKEFTYTQLLAVFFGKLIELTQLTTSIMSVENITVNLREIDHDIKQAIYEVFALLKLPAEKIKLQSCAESFVYYVLDEDPELWEKGAELFDFSAEGFFEKQLSVRKGPDGEDFVYVYENTHNEDFSYEGLENYAYVDHMDERLQALFQEVINENPISSVYFTGKGFTELWFGKTLQDVSENARAFKGNNLYAKGACLAGVRRASGDLKDYNIICNGRTKATIAVEASYKGNLCILNLSKAPIDYFDAGLVTDFILDDIRTIRFYITSLVSRERTFVDFDLSEFPQRPNKTTRVEIDIRYLNDCECEIAITDKGFGDFFPGSGTKVVKRLNMEGYV